MKRQHLQARPHSIRGRAFTWGRVPHLVITGGEGPTIQTDVEYQLRMRTPGGALYVEHRLFDVGAPRAGIARQLRGMRTQLRWTMAKIEAERARDRIGPDTYGAWLDAGAPERGAPPEA